MSIKSQIEFSLTKRSDMAFIDWEVLAYQNNIDMVFKLNYLLEIDPSFTQKITDTRFPVNDKYADSNFVCIDQDGETVAGFVGILNGLIENNDKYRICATYEGSPRKLIKFELLHLKDENKWEPIK
jgi:hypothetical protein